MAENTPDTDDDSTKRVSAETGVNPLGQVAAALDEMVSFRLQNESEGSILSKTLRAVIDAAVDAMVTIDHTGIVRAYNPVAMRTFQYEPGEVIGKNVKMLMPSRFREEHDSYLAAYLKTGVNKIIGIGREVTGRRKNGEQFPMELAVSELKLADQHLFVAVIRDISERKESQEQLRKLNEDLEARVRLRTQQLEEAHAELVRHEKMAILGQLAAGVAHEIRNPLGVIKNSTYYLELVHPKDDQEAIAAWGEVKRALDSASRIISELLDFAREPALNPIDISAHEVIQRALNVIKPPNNVIVNFPQNEVAPRLHVDAGQIQQVLENLILNAVQAMPNGGQLTLRTSLDESDRTVIEVTDTGVGISNEDLPRIFEPLFSKKVKGIGLGLSLSRRYAELNRGSLRVESVLGKQTTFRLTLPSK